MKSKKILAALISMAVLLAGCGSAEKSEAAASPPEKSEVSEQAGRKPAGGKAENILSAISGKQDIKYDDSLIEEMVSAEGEYTTASGEKAPYSYHVPKLKSDAPGAKKINESIYMQIGAYAEELAEAAKNGKEIREQNLSWSSYWLGSTVTLVLKTSDVSSLGQYAAYHYDFAADTSPDNRELVRKMGMSEEDFLSSARRAVIAGFDQVTIGMPMDDWYGHNYYSNVLPLRSKTLQEVQLDRMLLCPFEGGYTVISPVYTMDAAEYDADHFQYMFCDYLFEPAALPQGKTVTDGKITASLRNNQLYLSFSDHPELKVYLYGSQFPMPVKNLESDKEYPVQGLYGNYVDVEIGNFGQDYSPYILLRTKDGFVDMVDALNCLRYARFCAFPAYGLFGVTGFEKGSDTSYAADSFGNKHDLSQWVLAAWNSTPYPISNPVWYQSEPVTHKTQSGGGYEGIYKLLIEDKEGNPLILKDVAPDAGVEVQNKGTFRLLGMEDDGLVYGVTLYGADTGPDMPEILYSAMALRHQWMPDTYSYSREGMELRCVSGTDFLDTQGDWLAFSPDLSEAMG